MNLVDMFRTCESEEHVLGRYEPQVNLAGSQATSSTATKYFL